MGVIRISEMRFIPAPHAYQSKGLLGWVSCVVDEAIGLALGVRRTLDGRTTLSFPAKRGNGGEMHSTAWPIDQAVREQFEEQVLGWLGRERKLPVGPTRSHLRTYAESKERHP